MVIVVDNVVGVLGLQGDFAKHQAAFDALGCCTQLVRRPPELAACSHLVIPGGESTALARLVEHAGLRDPLGAFAVTNPVLGTCAGLILMATEIADETGERHGVEPFGLLDISVRRNGYGRQVDSFTEEVTVHSLDAGNPRGLAPHFSAVFIRAPRITTVGTGVTVLARRGSGGEPVAVRQGHLMGLTFHPELTDDLRFHRAFLELERTTGRLAG
jgi:5'-phosphate synthase pdxT subunit